MKVILLSAFVAGAAATGLKLHTSTKTHVHAEYNGLAAEMRHLGEKSGISRIYDSETGENFLQVKNIDGKTKMQYFDHPAIEFEKGEDAPEGLREHLDEFDGHPKVALIEQLSRELGSSDAQQEVVHWVHALAVNRAKSLEDKEKDVQKLLSTDEEEEVGWGRRRRRRRSGGPLINKCKNACFGRCGDGCSCWSWVCGSCGGHRGCFEHDYYCSCQGMWNARCIAFMAYSGTCNWPGCAASFCEAP